MDWLFAPMVMLVEYPIVAAAIGLALLGLGRRNRRGVVVGAGVLWLVYGAYEFGVQQRWLCSGECNIRIDLLVIHPLLALALAGAAVSLVRGSAGPPAPG